MVECWSAVRDSVQEEPREKSENPKMQKFNITTGIFQKNAENRESVSETK